MTHESSELPKEVKEFILKHIDSVEQLEILMLLRETAPRQWTYDEIALHLHSSKTSVEKRLKILCEKGLVRCGVKENSYIPQENTLEQVVQKLIEIYKTRRTRIIEFIFSRPDQNLISFANAFKLRKDK